MAPLSPPLKSGPTVPSVLPVHATTTAHKAVSTTSTVTTTGIPIADLYQPIPALKIYEGKQRNACFNYRSDVPTRLFAMSATLSIQKVSTNPSTPSLG